MGPEVYEVGGWEGDPSSGGGRVRGICVYMWLIYFIIQQKLTSILKQLYSNFKKIISSKGNSSKLYQGKKNCKLTVKLIQ